MELKRDSDEAQGIQLGGEWVCVVVTVMCDGDTSRILRDWSCAVTSTKSSKWCSVTPSRSNLDFYINLGCISFAGKAAGHHR